MTNTLAGELVALPALAKSSTGIDGLDEITNGGLPRGRPTLVCGSAGCGKTLLAIEFLVRGATRYGEPGVFMAFEETAEELAQNVRSLGFDLEGMIEEGKLIVDYVHIERSEVEETGEYDLEGLFIRLGHAIESIGAKRVVLDTIETLFGGLSNETILRSELRRLFRWLKDRGVTAIITGERGDKGLTRQGLEEYVSDCVILLDHRVTEELSTRRLRIVKYRGSTHGTNEYPFLIDEKGLTVLPITSLRLRHTATTERASSGIKGLDEMLGGLGVYRGSSVLVSGTAGTGKTSIAAYFADAACRRGERSLIFAFEESPDQLLRNMGSIGLELKPWLEQGLLRIHASRPSLQGIESHLTAIYREVRDFSPTMVIIDPMTSFFRVGSSTETDSMLTRIIDFLKAREVTSVFTSLVHGGNALEHSEMGVSSLIDTWVALRDTEQNGERNRSLYLVKSRGMAHSDQIREFLIATDGLQLKSSYVGSDGVYTGSARLAQEARDSEAKIARRAKIEHHRRELDRKQRALEAEITALRLEFEAEQGEAERAIKEEERREQRLEKDEVEMAQSRKVEPQPSTPTPDHS